MTCSAVSPPERDTEENEAVLATTVARLCGRPVLAVEPRMGGGNNRLYRVAVADDRFLALKSYGPAAADHRNDRLSREFSALSFLGRHGRDEVPEAVATDLTERLALYGWIDGTPPSRAPTRRLPDDMDAMIRFILAVQELRTTDGAAAIGPAAEACPDGAELLRQIRARLDVLAGLKDEPALTAFLRESFAPALGEAEERLHSLYRAEGLTADTPVLAERAILSPSDFGFHNALRRPDGRLAFLDLEYFGWDDPVKLLADTLWHPAYRLSPTEQIRWLEGVGMPLAATDQTLMVRLRACMPLYGLRWCVILLNEFLPERWRRRVRAGTTADWQQTKATQLAKAHGWLTEVHRLTSLPTSARLTDAMPLHLPALSLAE
ncbi:hypothetical protein [Azospirillum sp.]|uniref:hypothetical protein n=1 Tax=Azospirillum sp. TaxID=34012 RepID=UPI0026141D60|nr:hypothetical protein [Azospirillum sp.]